MTVRIAAFYRFFAFRNHADRRHEIARRLCRLGIKGSVLLAAEGINGTIAGSAEAIDKALHALAALAGTDKLPAKFATASEMPFQRLKVRLKREIVTLGVPETELASEPGIYVAPEDWNELIRDPGTLVIDTRNSYEISLGTFERAIDPQTDSFREFPNWFRRLKDKLDAEGRKPRIAMFCTGGIRCEKATRLAIAAGARDVYHLDGGILNYLEKIPPAASLWRGECFVFDERVSVRHDLTPGRYVLCRACGRAVGPEDQAASGFAAGLACPRCAAEKTDADRARFAERLRQRNAKKAATLQARGNAACLLPLANSPLPGKDARLDAEGS